MMSGITEPFIVFPDPPPALLAQTLDLAGYPWKAVANASIAAQHEPPDGWAGAVICAEDDPEGAFGICRSLRKRDAPLEPILLLVSGAQLAELEMREDVFDDFCLAPFHPRELEARLRHLHWRTGRTTRPEVVDAVSGLEDGVGGDHETPWDLPSGRVARGRSCTRSCGLTSFARYCPGAPSTPGRERAWPNR